MYKTLVVVVISLLGVTYALLDSTCQSAVECDPDECCHILSEFMAVSKKDSIAPIDRTTGTCQKYRQEGQYCDSLSQMNGYCSCAPGLTCTYAPALPVNTKLPAKFGEMEEISRGLNYTKAIKSNYMSKEYV